MNIDVDKFDIEQERLRIEATKLVENGLLIVTKTNFATGEFRLTDKGELYIFQKILGPIIKIKDKGKIEELKKYLTRYDSDTQTRVLNMINDMNTQTQSESVRRIADRILNHAMPYLNALNSIHDFARFFSL